MTDIPLIVRADAAGITTLTLNRPQARNALSLGMLQALLTELERIATDSRVRVVVLAGAGPAFCAGHDLKEIRAANFDGAYTRTLFNECARVMLAIVGLPAGGELRSGRSSRRRSICDARSQYRTLLLCSHGGSVPQCESKGRNADAADGRADRCGHCYPLRADQ